mmetsp:Transcript_50934/g.115920  ORF Transcript_50934/g.115920 Transcript_50934/m.115920 type:complete len:324 (+) Transcript_50934:64-1035(+)
MRGFSMLVACCAAHHDSSAAQHLVVGYAECKEGRGLQDYKFRYSVCPPTEESLDVVCSFDTLSVDLYAHIRPGETVTGYLDLALWGKEHNTTVVCRIADPASAITPGVFRLLPGGACPDQDICRGGSTTTTTTTIATTSTEAVTAAPLVRGALTVEQTCSEGARLPGAYRVQVCPPLNINLTQVTCNGQEFTIPAAGSVDIVGNFAEGETVICTAPYPLVSAGQIEWSTVGPCEQGCPAPGAVASAAVGQLSKAEEAGSDAGVIMGVVGAGIALVLVLAVSILLICSARRAKRYAKKEQALEKKVVEMEAGFASAAVARAAGC